MDLSLSSILAGIVFGAIGFWMFKVGKSESKPKILFIGLLLMIYPYFTNGPLANWGVGIALCGLAKYLWYT